MVTRQSSGPELLCAREPDLYNWRTVRGAAGGFTVSVNAKNSIFTGGPAINAKFSFTPDGRGGFTTSGNRDAFPSAEAYLWRNGTATTLFQRDETSPFSLIPIFRNDRW